MTRTACSSKYDVPAAPFHQHRYRSSTQAIITELCGFKLYFVRRNPLGENFLISVPDLFEAKCEALGARTTLSSQVTFHKSIRTLEKSQRLYVLAINPIAGV